eukprot:SAG22_NODE_17709_length_300_cov_0.542289_1_plen_41_part_01
MMTRSAASAGAPTGRRWFKVLPALLLLQAAVRRSAAAAATA